MIMLLSLLFSLNLYASDVSKPSSVSAARPGYAPVNLGDCKPALDPKTNTEEVFARNASEKADLSNAEILARLIYSESLSTGYWNGKCNAKSDLDIMTGIGWGIMNRIKGKSGKTPYADVIFGKSQFRTSFSGKKDNPFAEAFLCPSKSQNYLNQTSTKEKSIDLYRRAQQLSEKIVAEFEATKIPPAYSGITNFFYPQSEFFGEMRPTWAPDKDATKNKGYMNILKVADKPCVEFYKLK